MVSPSPPRKPSASGKVWAMGVIAQETEVTGGPHHQGFHQRARRAQRLRRLAMQAKNSRKVTVGERRTGRAPPAKHEPRPGGFFAKRLDRKPARPSQEARFAQAKVTGRKKPEPDGGVAEGSGEHRKCQRLGSRLSQQAKHAGPRRRPPPARAAPSREVPRTWAAPRQAPDGRQEARKKDNRTPASARAFCALSYRQKCIIRSASSSASKPGVWLSSCCTPG